MNQPNPIKAELRAHAAIADAVCTKAAMPKLITQAGALRILNATADAIARETGVRPEIATTAIGHDLDVMISLDSSSGAEPCRHYAMCSVLMRSPEPLVYET